MKANYFNLLLLLFVGIPFIMGVVSVTNAMYTLNMSATPAYTNTTTTTPAPSGNNILSSSAAALETTAGMLTTTTTTSSTLVAKRGNTIDRSLQHRVYLSQDLPLITQYFTIVCPMFGNCTRSGAGVASDSQIGTLEKVSEALGCSTQSVNLARAFCLIALIVSVMATAGAAGAAQEVTCSEKFWVRVVILASSAATLVFSLVAVVLISTLRTCLSGKFEHIERLVTFFSPRAAESNVDSIAFPVYVCAMSFAAAAVVMSILWIRGIVGPEAVDRAADEEEAKRKEKEMQSKLLLDDDDDDHHGGDGNHHAVDVLGSGTEKVNSHFNNLSGGGQGDHDALLFPAGGGAHGRERDFDDDPAIDVDDFLGGMESGKRE
jgi:hypothetical protein